MEKLQRTTESKVVQVPIAIMINDNGAGISEEIDIANALNSNFIKITH